MTGLRLHPPLASPRRLSLPAWPDLALAVILALLPALFFWRLIAPNPADRMNIPAGDFTGQYYPLRYYAAQELAAGRLPLWNPYPYGGQPGLADIQSGALYPPQAVEAWLLARLGLGFPVWALEIQAIAHLSWAALGAYLLGRHLARRAGAGLRQARFAGTVVSLVFTYSGYLTGFPVQQLTILEVSAWAPWVLLAVDRLAISVLPGRRESEVPSSGTSASAHQPSAPGDPEPADVPPATLLSCSLLPTSYSLLPTPWTASPPPGPIVLAGLALGLSLLPGHPQTSLYVVYLAVALFVFRVLSALPAARSLLPTPCSLLPTPYSLLPTPYSLLSAACSLLLALLLAFALAAAQLLPGLELIARSARAGMSYAAVSFGLPLHEMVALVYPGYLGGSPEYVGILPLVLVGLAWALGRPGRDVAFWTATGLLGLLLALGDNTFLYSLFYLLIPGFDAVRHQERAFLVYALSAAALSGYGALALARPLDRARRLRLARFERGLRRVFWAALALTALFVFGWAAGRHADLFAGVLRHHVLGLILLAGGLVLLALRPAGLWRRPWGMALVAGWIAFNLFTVNWRFNLEQPGATGPFPDTELTRFLQARADESSPPPRVASAGLLPGGPGAASVYRLYDVGGNSPLHLDAVEAFEAGVPEWRRWQLLNVGYVLSQRDLEGPGLSRVFPAGAPAEGQAAVYAVGDPLPRAWVVHAVEVLPDDRAALARLAADEFDLRRAAVVDRPLPDAVGAPAGAGAGGSTARFLSYAPGHMLLEVDAAAGGLLVLSEVWYPGWRVTVDGEPAGLVRADYLLRGVPVPAGRHTVRVWYAPLSFAAGAAISLAALALALVVAARAALRRFRRGGHP